MSSCCANRGVVPTTQNRTSCGGAYLCGTPACGQKWIAIQKPEFHYVIEQIRDALSKHGSTTLTSRSNPCGLRYFLSGGIYQNSHNQRFSSFDMMMDDLIHEYRRARIDGISICAPSIAQNYLKSDIILFDGKGDPNDDRCC